MNLAVNARDAMPNGGHLTIHTSLETHLPRTHPDGPELRNGQFICLTFTDTGTGMDTQILGRIFEPFFTTKPAWQGHRPGPLDCVWHCAPASRMVGCTEQVEPKGNVPYLLSRQLGTRGKNGTGRG